MKIETKFDIGDKVWRIIGGERKYYIARYSVVVIHPRVHSTSKPDKIYKSISYDCSSPGQYIGVHERELFRTKKQAQAECDKRNKESK